MPAKKMVNLSIEETSGVDHPAHLVEGWVIVKAADRSGVEAAINALAAEAEGQEDNIVSDQIETPEAEVEVDTAPDAELVKAQERIAELEAALAAATAEVVVEDSEEALIKSAPAPVRKMLEKARAEADAAREELQKERDAQRDRDFVE